MELLILVMLEKEILNRMVRAPVVGGARALGVELGITSQPSHSEPDLRLSPHPATG